MPKFEVCANVTLRCTRTVEAIDEDDAIEQSSNISANEWVEGFTVESEHVEDLEAYEIKEKKTEKKKK